MTFRVPPAGGFPSRRPGSGGAITTHDKTDDGPVPPRHTMSPTGRTESHAEEWACPICGRRMLLHWPPDYSKVVLEAGDETVIHVSGSPGLQFSTAEDLLPADRQWLHDNGIDWDGIPA